MNLVGGLIFIAGGLYYIYGILFDWDFESIRMGRMAGFLVEVLGHMGAQICYVIFGIFIVAIGVLIICGVIPSATQD